MKNFLIIGIVLSLMLLLVSCQERNQEVNVPENPAIDDPMQEKNMPEPAGNAMEEKEMIDEAGEVEILGNEGFSPEVIRVDAESSVRFVNRADKAVVLTFQMGRKTSVSQQIRPGDSYEHAFSEAGEYTFWTVGYGVRGTAIVE